MATLGTHRKLHHTSTQRRTYTDQSHEAFREETWALYTQRTQTQFVGVEGFGGGGGRGGGHRE